MLIVLIVGDPRSTNQTENDPVLEHLLRHRGLYAGIRPAAHVRGPVPHSALHLHRQPNAVQLQRRGHLLRPEPERVRPARAPATSPAFRLLPAGIAAEHGRIALSGRIQSPARLLQLDHDLPDGFRHHPPRFLRHDAAHQSPPQQTTSNSGGRRPFRGLSSAGGCRW